NDVERGAERRRGAAICIAQQRAAQCVERAAKLQRQAGGNAQVTDTRVEVAACFMIRDKNFADAAIREVRISGDEADSVLFEVEACCRAPVRQPLANVFVIDLIGEGHVRFQIKANSSGATESAILVVEADLDVVEVVPVGGEYSLDRRKGSNRLAVSVC